MKAESAEVVEKKISGGSVAPGYLIFGEEAYWHERVISTIGASMSGGAEALSGAEITWDSLRDVLAQPTFFGPQLWVVREAQELVKSGDERFVASIAPGTCLVLSCVGKDNPASKQFMAKWEALQGALVQAALPSFSEASRWVTERLQKDGLRITPDALETLITLTGRSIERLDNETDKLVTYAGRPGVDGRNREAGRPDEDIRNREAGRPTVEITSQVVAQCVSGDPDKTPFGLIDAIMARNAPKAFAEYRELLSTGSNPVAIIALLASHFGVVWRAKEAEPKRLSQDQLAKTLGMHPYAAKKAAAEARNWTYGQLEAAIRTLCAVDENLKRGRMDPDRAMDYLLIKVCRG